MAGISNEERKRREAQKQTEADARVIENPREPTYPVAEDAEPKTDASGAIGGSGTPGTVEPEPAEAVYDQRVIATPKVQMVTVRLKRAYWAADGSGRLDEGEETDLPIEDSRRLIEAGVAEYVAHVPEK